MAGELEKTRQSVTPGDFGLAATAPSREPGMPMGLTHIGRFVVLRKLGEGGMGVVYAAYDEELERKVAIKLLRGEFHGQRQSVGQARLLREAQAMAKLSHQNIVQVYEVGKLGSGVFLAMEFVHGHNLREWLELAKRPWREVLAAFMQAGHGLAAAHAGGIVHRDFKPDNVLIGDDQRVRVVDFGLARPDEASDRDTTPPGISSTRLPVELTQAGAFVGTPAYMSPEQLSHEPADAKSDQFSFCVALYEGLYGHRPFPGADTEALREAVLFGEPLDPPRDTDVPRWVHQALLHGLRREPAQRFAEMNQLLAALAADPSIKRRRRLGIVGTVLASGLAAVAGGIAVFELRAAPAAVCVGGEQRLAGVWDPDVAASTRAALVGTGVGYAADVASRVASRLDEYTAGWAAMHLETCETHLRGDQSDALFDLRMACLDERRTAVQALVEVFAGADAAMVEQAVQAADQLPSLTRCADTRALLAQTPPPEDPAVARAVEQLRARVATARAKHKVGQYKEAQLVAQQLRVEAEALGYAPLLAETLYLEGTLADTIGDYPTAESTLVLAVAAADGARDDELRVSAQTDLVQVAVHQARYAEAVRYAELIRGALARLSDPAPAEAELETNLGALFVQQGLYDRAEPHVARSIELVGQLHGADSLEFASVITARGSLRFYRGELAAALEDYRRTVTIYQRAYGPNHPALGNALNNVGAVELTQFDNDAAEASFLQAKEILEGAYGATHPALGALHANVGMIAINQGRPTVAVAELRRALAIYQQLLEPDHPSLADLQIELGNGLLYAGDHAGALQTYAEALPIYLKAYGPGHAKTTMALARSGAAQLVAGDLAAAEQSFTRAVSEFRGEATAPELGTAYAGLGQLRLVQGRFAEAATQLETAVSRLEHDPAPWHLADAQFALAQALVRIDRTHETRARSLAEAAQHNFIRVGAGFRSEAAKVQAWLDTLPAAGR